jgi:acetyl-CoA acyltransferase
MAGLVIKLLQTLQTLPEPLLRRFFTALQEPLLTSDNVAKKHGISHRQQDKHAVRSHAKAALAIQTGRFKE